MCTVKDQLLFDSLMLTPFSWWGRQYILLMLENCGSSVLFLDLLPKTKMACFPPEITTQILSRLPIKSILRFRQACTDWCSLLDDPVFVKMQSSFSASEIQNASSFLLLPFRSHDHLFIVQDCQNTQKSLIKYSKINTPFPLIEFFIAGSSHGLLCFSTLNHCSYFNTEFSLHVCNPATQEIVQLPHILDPPHYFVSLGYGFGFDPATEQFKAVVYWRSLSQVAQVYSSASNSWTKVEPDIKNLVISGGSQVYLNGSVFWLQYTQDQAIFYLVSFDLRLEKFRIIPKPNLSLQSNQRTNTLGPKFVIGELRGCLSLSDGRSCEDRYEIWIMKDYNVKQSWTKLFAIKHLGHERIHDRIKPICYRKNGEVILLCDSCALVSYNLTTGQATRIEDDQFPPCVFAFGWYNEAAEAIPYLGTLISPKSFCK